VALRPGVARRIGPEDPHEVNVMTEQNRDRTIEDPRDPKTEPPGAHAGTGAAGRAASEGIGAKSGGPDAERDESGLGAESASGLGGWQGGEPAQSESGALGRGESGSLGSGGAAASQSGAGQSNWDEQVAGETGGAHGPGGVVGGERWEGRERDTGGGGWTQNDDIDREHDRADRG
jgi:hypothetical protein